MLILTTVSKLFDLVTELPNFGITLGNTIAENFTKATHYYEQVVLYFTISKELLYNSHTIENLTIIQCNMIYNINIPNIIRCILQKTPN